MLKSLLFISLVLTGSPAAMAADYCLALRGNGELEPAHWGAVSKVVERLGLPQAQAGGSSASITMFLVDAVATNKLVRSGSPLEQRTKASLLVKSFEGFLIYLLSTQQFQDFTKLYGEGLQAKDINSLEQVQALLATASQKDSTEILAFVRENLELIRRDLATALQIGLISKESVDPIIAALEDGGVEGVRQARFAVSELLESIRRLGDFDADGDANLFFRPGVVDFNQIATQVGRIGDFYASADFSEFFSKCRVPAEGKLWSELTTARPECANVLNDLIKAHFKTADRDAFSSLTVGVTIPSFPTTAVLTGSAQDEVAKAFAKYKTVLSADFGKDFHISDSEQVHFGYWGNEERLQRIQDNLPAGDEKSRRFMALGEAPWHEVLSLSPAEPGLSALKFFSHGKDTFVSAGGWSDLAPVLVLKAAGCKNVVYATRRGTESPFAQGVARRLFGPAYDQQNLAAKLFDLDSAGSSLKRSLETADAVLCTDWNRFKIKDGANPMVVDAYKAPYYLSSSSGLGGEKLTPRLDPKERAKDGTLKYFGCY